MQCSVEWDVRLAAQGLGSEGRFELELDRQKLSVAELIRAAVRAQMLLRRLREQSQVAVVPAGHLSESDIQKGLKSGRIALKKAQAAAATDWFSEEQRELAHALKLFQDGGFQVLLDGQLHRDSERIVEINEQSSILFLRLMPLAGG